MATKKAEEVAGITKEFAEVTRAVGAKAKRKKRKTKKSKAAEAKTPVAEQTKKPVAVPSTPVMPPLFATLTETTFQELMAQCHNTEAVLRYLLIRLLLEQKQRAHENRMLALKQLGSAVAFLPIAAAQQVAKLGPVIGRIRGLIRRKPAAEYQDSGDFFPQGTAVKKT